MKAVIHQALGHVFHFDAARSSIAADRRCIRARPDRVCLCREPGNNYRAASRCSSHSGSRFSSPLSGHRRPSSGYTSRKWSECLRCPKAPARRRRRRFGFRTSDLGLSDGRNGTRCFATPIGPMPGPPPPCGMQKVLCRLRWQTSAPMSPGRHRPHLRVHVRAVHVNLAAVRMNDLANLADGRFENAVRRGIGDHQRREIVFVLRPLLRADRPRQCCHLLRSATGTTLKPAMTALAGLVPCADVGMRQILR